MVENDIFTTQTNKIVNGQTKSPVCSLITLERSQKLDLLAHLITNLRQSLIVCGPVGIGKTTLLNVLKERASPDWRCFYIQAGHHLSFEGIQEQLSYFIQKQQKELKTLDLNGYLVQLAQRNQKLVLIIDNAGLLVPGLIDALNRYSLTNPSLRIIFALTQDELYVRNSSDRTVDECHFIELPPLSEKQCGEFLQNLSSKPGSVVSFNAINDTMIAHLYQETHGIPGRIMEELPHLSEYGQVRAVKWTLVVSVILVVMAGLIYWAWEENRPVKPLAVETLPSAEPSMKRFEFTQPKIQLDNQPSIFAAPEVGIEDDKNAVATAPVNNTIEAFEDLNQQPHSETEATAGIEAEVIESQVATAEQTVATEKVTAERPLPEPEQEHAESVQAKPIKAKAEPVLSVEPPRTTIESHKAIEPESGKPVSETDDRQWLNSQSPKNYTLQLIALSSRQSLLALMKKYSSLQPHFKYIKTVSNQKEKYILLYGSFNSYASAGSAMQKLPREFRKSWIRRFKVLQNDIKNEN